MMFAFPSIHTTFCLIKLSILPFLITWLFLNTFCTLHKVASLTCAQEVCWGVSGDETLRGDRTFCYCEPKCQPLDEHCV